MDKLGGVRQYVKNWVSYLRKIREQACENARVFRLVKELPKMQNDDRKVIWVK